MKTQENASLDELLKKADALLKSSNKSLADGRAMDEAIAFALEQWKTNKRWFRDDDADMLDEQKPHFFQTKYWRGLTMWDVKKIINYFNR